MGTQISGNLSTTSHSNNGVKIDRHIAQFHQPQWGNGFRDYIPDDEATKVKKEHQIKKLVDEIKEGYLSGMADKLLTEQLNCIDALQRLGISYHFENEVEVALQNIYNKDDVSELHNLYYTSLGFRLLRQHGFYISSGIFRDYTDEKGNFKECLKNDVEGILSLYEAAHLRTHGDDILDEAIAFTTNHLKSLATSDQLNYPLSEKVNDALYLSLHRSLPRLKTRHYIPIYEHDPSHNKILLKLAKLDFNHLQCCHKEELKDHVRWWNDLDLPRKLGYIKDRIVEASFWGVGIYYEPHYVLGRKFCSRMCQLLTVMDDTYDAFGTVEELELFTQAIHRWDKKCMDELNLPDYLKTVYIALFDAHEEIEQDLAFEGRSDYVNYITDELKILSRHYLQETKWCYEKYIPNYDEYIKTAIQTVPYTYATALAFLAMGPAATPQTFEWACGNPPPVVASCAILRLLDDIVSRKFEQERDHVASAVECYMKQYDVLEKEAIDEILKKVEDYWKDLNQVLLRPSEIPLPLASCVLNCARAAEVLYRNGADEFTSLGSSMKDNVRILFIDSIPI